MISYLLEQFPKQTYHAILGLIIASIVGVFLAIKDPLSNDSYEMQTPIYEDLWSYISAHPWTILIGLLMLVGGFTVTRYLTKFELKGAKKDA